MPWDGEMGNWKYDFLSITSPPCMSPSSFFVTMLFGQTPCRQGERVGLGIDKPGPCHLLAMQSHFAVPQFPHLQNGDYNHSNLIELFSELNEIIYVQWLALWVSDSHCAKTLAVKIVIMMVVLLLEEDFGGKSRWLNESTDSDDTDVFSLPLPDHLTRMSCLFYGSQTVMNELNISNQTSFIHWSVSGMILLQLCYWAPNI